MSRLATLLAVAFALTIATSVRAQSPPTPVAATPDNAATFLGDWTVSANGSYGPATFAVTLKVVDGKLVGEVSSASTGKQAITDLAKVGTSLRLQYAFDYQGTPVDAVIVLTPADNKVEAFLDFANGAAQMTGAATRQGN